MKNNSESRSQTRQILAFLVFSIYLTHRSAANAVDSRSNAEILFKGHLDSNSNYSSVPKIVKLAHNGDPEVLSASEPTFTLKSDQLRVQSDFRTVDINVLNRQRDKENAKKLAIVQEDLQSRIKVNEPETVSKETVEEVTEPETDPEEARTKQAKVKEDIESRILLDDDLLGYRLGSEGEEKLHYPVKRSDDDYYADEPEAPQQGRMTTEPPKEEDSFFSIFESLFGSSDDESQSKKKSNPEDEHLFKDPGEESLKENIKTVGSLLKPLKPIDKPESETQPALSGYQTNVPEYRIVNNFHSSQYHKPPYKQSESKPNYHSAYRPTENPFRPYKPHTTNGYEDYDLEEFMNKGPSSTKVKYVSPTLTAISTSKHPTTITTIPTTTTVRTTTKNTYDNKLRFPSIQKKNDYINRNQYQEVKQEPTEKVTERVTYKNPEIKTTTEIHYYSKPNHENKGVEIKTQKIQESPNFYNLINLPVRYSTKDTAIPLISTSYANTKIQGMGAYKYEKGGNGKYPNHKYDQVSSGSSISTTKGPTYWATKRTSTERTTTSFRPSPMIPKTTTKYEPGSDLDKIEYDDVPIGMGPELGNYGSKTSAVIKTQVPYRQTSTVTLYKETTTRQSEIKPTSEETIDGFHNKQDETKQSEKVPEKTSVKPVKEIYGEYEYDNFSDQESGLKISSQNYPPNFKNKERPSESQYKTQYYTNSYKTTRPSTTAPVKEPIVPSEVEYEYYDYDADTATTTTVTTTTTKRTTTTSTTTPASKYKIKYPSLSKDKVKTSSSEKVSVVVPSKDSEYYKEDQSKPEPVRTSTVVIPSTNTVVPTASSKPPQTTTTTSTTGYSKVPENEIPVGVQKTTPQFYAPKPAYKEPAPVFEDVREEYTTKQVATSITKKVSDSPLPTEATVRPVIVTSSTKDQEKNANANIVLVPTKEIAKSTEAEEKFSQSQPFPTGSFQKTQQKHTQSFQPGFDYTTEFTVGFVQGGQGGFQGPGKNPGGQGHFVASSISTNPHGDDEPFRPIPKPPGLLPNYQIAHEDIRRPLIKNPAVLHNPPPSTPPALEETEPVHEPHEFIPSPQFHRPIEPKPSIPVRPGSDLDYDFEGIQTEPKPGQYVIFSKPQLKPEMNESQLKKKPEIISPTKVVSNAPHYHEKVNPYWQDSQKHVVFNPKEGQIYQNPGKPKLPLDKSETGRPVPSDDDSLPLQLVPPKENQPEQPFEGNFVLPEENQESTVSYPRPHWEKNGKPSFLTNTLTNKNDMVGGRPSHLPPQMVPTLIPPSSIPPQRFRRPLHPHMPPLRKNFNEAGTNVKPKPNLPNILPQFRPNTKVGSGPYHRPPPGYPNRRNGLNRYHDKEHGSFPYHIQHPEKDAPAYREYEAEPEIIPKFITNRGKLPSEVWNSQGMQKRFGQGPQNMASDESQKFPQQNQRILRRHQRTPVTTLQMLKQMSGVKTQKTHVSREDSADSSVPLFPPIFKNYVDQPKNNEKVYIVYPARAPQKLHSDDAKVFIVSDTKSKKNYYNFTKAEERQPLVNSNRKDNSNNKSKPNFPYGFVKPADRTGVKESEEDLRKTVKGDASEEEQTPQETKVVLPVNVREKDEKIDMMLHMQSNNQWNEVRTPPDSMLSFRNPSEMSGSEHYRFADNEERRSQPGSSQIQLNPPSEYHTAIKDDSAFTLGAVMHTMSEGSKRGQVVSIPLHSDDEGLNLPKLNVNERISNGKIVTVSMPLDVKQDPGEKDNQSEYQFQVPFQPSSSLTSNGSYPVSQGWSIVTNPDDKSGTEDGSKTTESPTNSSFNFENFKPELIGGFKPLFEIPEKPEEEKKEKPSDGAERVR